jgi:drug/metabolite transporter (DMT)-like permease
VALRLALLTTIALVAFAGNSLLCRLALAQHEIDAASFTAVRLVTGALALVALLRARSPGLVLAGTWPSAAALFVYAAPFSFAYLRLDASTGTLLAFAVVQAVMIGWGLHHGERPRPLAWCGLAIALAGLAALTLPGASAPDPLGAIAMAIAGTGWAIYSLRGRRPGDDPLAATAGNFVRSVPMVCAATLVFAMFADVHASARGIALAATSGVLASGVGYSVWYAALPQLSATRAAMLQLLVPIIATGGGIALLHEPLTMRLVACAAAILGGVALAIRSRT